jgi:hypothetical protein
MTSDTIDFKPFFDMVIGILFILLILISAQLFFSQWGNQATPEERAAEAREAKRQRVLADEARFLDDLAARLKAAGYEAQADKAGKSVAVDFSGVARGPLALDERRVERLARALLPALRCIGLSTAATSPRDDCPKPYAVRLSQLATRAELTGDAPGATPQPPQRVFALQFAAMLFAAMPEALSIAGPGGALAVRSDVPIDVVAARSTPPSPGQVRFRFGFVEAE